MAVHYSQSQQQQQLFQMAASLAGCGGGAGNQSAAELFPQIMVPPPPPVFSEPVSELTCNVSGSRKRAREDEPLMPLLQTTCIGGALFLYQQQQQQQQQLLLANNQMMQRSKTTQPQAYVDLMPVDSSRLNQSMMTSTSGRVTTDSPSPALSNLINNSNNTVVGSVGLSSPSPCSSPGLISMLHYQSLEVDALVRLHTEKLRSVLEDARKRQCRAVLAALGQQAQRRIAEKQAELDDAAKRNAELQERLRQAASESQAWFNVARNSESLVASLRASLEQALLQKLSNDGEDNNNGNCGGGASGDVLEEGYGDSEEEAVSAAAAPAAAVSCSVRVPGAPCGGARKCKSCGVPDACVLLLPCRHLCLCRTCEPSVDHCPVCSARKNGSLQVNLS